jgi:CHAD domain-containing protein
MTGAAAIVFLWTMVPRKASGLNDRIAVFLDAAKAYLDRYLAGLDPEDLHQMRLSLKRARALAWIHDKAGGHRRIRKQLKSWIRLYRLSGEVRDLEVQLKLLSSLDAPPVTITRWEALLAHARDSFLEEARGGDGRLVKSTRNIRRHAGCLAANPAIETVRQLWTDATRDLDPANSLHWHENRKRLKRLIYLDRQLPGMFHLLPLVPYSIGMRMDDLQDTIGKWHDVVIVLEAFDRHPMTEAEAGFFREVLKPRLAALIARVHQDADAWLVLARTFQP